MIFTWTPQKARRNAAKHSVTFNQAAEIFSDPNHIAVEDIFDGEEQRYQVIGLTEELLLLLVVCVFRSAAGDEVIHIISARRAISHERAAYLKYLK